jgi:hypothetical protein
MSHLFKVIDPPKYIFTESGFLPRGSCKICTKCNLVVHTEAVYEEFINDNGGFDHSDYFYLNGKEVYNKFIVLEQLNLTCDELIIKQILE